MGALPVRPSPAPCHRDTWALLEPGTSSWCGCRAYWHHHEHDHACAAPMPAQALFEVLPMAGDWLCHAFPATGYWVVWIGSNLLCVLCAVLAVLIILLLEVTTGQGVLTRWLTL